MSTGPYPTQQSASGPQPPPLFLQPTMIPLPYAPIAQPSQPGMPNAPPYPLNTGFLPMVSQQAGTQPAQQQQPYIGFAPQEQFPAAPPPYTGPGQGYRGPGQDFGKPLSEPGSTTEPMERDTEPAIESWSGFSNKEIRRIFVRKVYAILMVQLAITFAFIALFIYEPHVKGFVQTNLGAYIAAYVAFFVLYLALVCCESLRRSYPTNIILLFVFTLVMSYMVGVISSFHNTETVFMAAGICAACCLAVSVFSFHTKFDFTSCAGFLFVAVWALFLFGILTIFTYNRILNTVYAVLGAVLFMAFLAFDTQMLMGGRKLELSPEEHIFAALQLYMDIVQIFLFILRIMGSKR
uniref:Putative n-methyl-d-aspartate receptor glutamate-binding subunit n=1 Tax=Amblyomma triste TaxID=251400 RepID=A0A023GM03_AMBTT